MNCAKVILRNVFYSLVTFAGIALVVAATATASIAPVKYFELNEGWVFVFALSYSAILFGVIVGIRECRSAS